jgi:hypothetical protein
MPTEVLREESVERARFLLQSAAPGRYNLVGHNCEHAATWCVTGFPESHQVRIGLYLNAGFGAATVLAVSLASRSSNPPPRCMLATMAIGCLVVTSYHVHQGRFVREIDRAWRTRRR